MRLLLVILLLALLAVSSLFGQGMQTSRTDLTKEMLAPSEQDFADAKSENLQAFRILPRGMFDYESNALSLRGGGAYYSFTKKSNSYNEIPQLQFEQNTLSVGFSRASYGLMADLGNLPLRSIDASRSELVDMINYYPPQIESMARIEFKKLGIGLNLGDSTFYRELQANVGNSYVLRAISYKQADTLVAFKIHRKDDDGSLIVFWKMIMEFEKPIMTVDNIPNESREKALMDAAIPDPVVKDAIIKALAVKGFNYVTVESTTNEITVRGSVPKGKAAELMMLVMKIGKRKVTNHVIER